MLYFENKRKYSLHDEFSTVEPFSGSSVRQIYLDRISLHQVAVDSVDCVAKLRQGSDKVAVGTEVHSLLYRHQFSRLCLLVIQNSNLPCEGANTSTSGVPEKVYNKNLGE